jgi:hypothetical protein
LHRRPLSWLVAAATLTAATTVSAQPVARSPHFNFDATLRIDLHHVGNDRQERFIVDELRVEGAWPGSRTALKAAGKGKGTTRVEILSLPRQQLVFSRGHCSLFGEWRTTAEAKKRSRVFSETVRLPLPLDRFKLVVKSRNKRGKWDKVFVTTLDPNALSVSRERRRAGLKVIKLHHSGAPATALDVVILGDGYQAWQMDKFKQDAQRFARLLLFTKPFSNYRDKINVWAVESPSREDGVDEPRKGIFKDTALSMSFNTFGSARYLMTTANKAVHDIAANAPYDAVYIVSNTSRYGGGGIYNLYSSFVSDNAYDAYVFIHEFGHSFAGLGDEYYSSKVAYSGMYPKGVEPWEPNITGQSRRKWVKWHRMIDKGTPVPTQETDPRYANKVGVFEGAGYSAKGLYRPAVDCKMFNKGHKDFCPVCMQAVSKTIERYTK